jgi:uridine nucleosidase
MLVSLNQTVVDHIRPRSPLRNAEFNIVVDPEAAKLVFSNLELAAKTILIPLDVTHQVLATKEVQNLLLHGGSLEEADTLDKFGKPSTLRKMLVELVNFFAHSYATVFGITEGPPLHDPLAVAAILDGITGQEIPFYDYEPGHKGRKERYEVSIVTEGTHEQALKGETQTGRTIVKLLEKGEGGIKIPRGLNVQRFWTVIEQCLGRADEKNRNDAVVEK